MTGPTAATPDSDETTLWDTFAVGEPLSSTTFAGRETELDQLCTVFASLETSGARTVLVGGEAGIGKTRLVEEFRSRARAAGVWVAVGVCTPAEGGRLPYAPVVGVVRELGRVLDEPVASSALLAVRRELGLVDPSAAGEDPTRGERAKTRLFEAVLLCLTTLAERGRVVIGFEDLQWADSATLDLFDFLVRNLAAAPVLVVGTFRNDELEDARPLRRVLTELGRHRSVSHLELTGLDRDAIAALMAGILGRQPEWALVDAVHGRCAGNPFFAEELTAARDATSLPSVLRNVILLRIDRLAPDARRVVAIAAAAGPKVDHRLLSAVSDLDDSALHASIAEAVERGVLVVDDGRFASGTRCNATRSPVRCSRPIARACTSGSRPHSPRAPTSVRPDPSTPRSSSPCTGGRRANGRTRGTRRSPRPTR